MKYNIENLLETMAILRGENGCPWDREQSYDNLKKYIIEETYEVAGAINNKDFDNLCEELGDLLFQIIFVSQIAKEESKFTFSDVVNNICAKMIMRHPHIFSDSVANNSDDVIENWEKNKQKEKGYSSHSEVLKNIPPELPALMRADKIQSKSFNFADDEQLYLHAIDCVSNQLATFKSPNLFDKNTLGVKIGNILFYIVLISRFLQLNPEFALTKSLETFINRFENVESAEIPLNNRVDSIFLKILTEMNVG